MNSVKSKLIASLLVSMIFATTCIIPVIVPCAMSCVFGMYKDRYDRIGIDKRLSIASIFVGELVFYLFFGLIIFSSISPGDRKSMLMVISSVFLSTFLLSVFFYFFGRNNWWGRLVEWKNRLKESESDEDGYEDLSCKVVAFRNGFSIKRVNGDLYFGEYGEFVSPLEEREIYSFTLYSEAQKFLDENKNIFKLIKNE